MQKERIWEIDAFRGILILCMVAVHLIYDLQNFFLLPVLTHSRVYALAAKWGGVLFFLLSGICATLGSRHIRRGLAVFFCGVGISAVTAGLYLLGFAQRGILIYFGVLHCLGLCMVLWQFFQKLPLWGIGLAAAGMIAAGFTLIGRRFETGLWLLPLGFAPTGFLSADYFPLLPFFGFFLLGAVLGKTLYKQKRTLFPSVSPENLFIRLLCRAGKGSLMIYILHQPVLLGAMYAWEAIL